LHKIRTIVGPLPYSWCLVSARRYFSSSPLSGPKANKTPSKISCSNLYIT
jgi:hypothetical protein